jgi:predicted ATPase
MTDARYSGGVGTTTARGRALALTSWRLKNFKSVEEAEVDLAPLTVLVGANSSGKSTLIQSILAVTQAVRSRGTGGSFPLNGELVSLGSYQDSLRMGALDDDALSIGGVLERVGAAAHSGPDRSGPLPTRTTRVVWNVEMAGTDDREPGSALIRSVEYDHEFVSGESLSWRLQRDLAEGSRRRQRLGFSGPGAEGPVVDFAGGVSWRPSDEDQVGLITADVEAAGVVLAAGLPLAAFVEKGRHRDLAGRWYDMVRRSILDEAPRGRLRTEFLHRRAVEQSPLFGDDRALDLLPEPAPSPSPREEAVGGGLTERLIDLCARWVEEAERGSDRPVGIRTVLGEVLDEFGHGDFLGAFNDRSALVERVIGRLGEGVPILVEPDTGIVEATRTAGQDVLGFFRSNVRYLGPLRQDPQFTYRTAPSAESGQFGTKGEYTVALLHANAKRRVRVPLPDAPATWIALETAVSRWLRHFEVGTGLTTRSAGRPGLEALIRQQGLSDDLPLTSVGVGVSQLLPVVVMALLSPPGSLLLFEQPELHLHPAPQQRLADFLVACARSGRRLIVETHSEYLVTRLRLLVAQDESNTTGDLLRIVYAQREDAKTTYKEVGISPYGGIEEWPAGFFDQGSADAAALLRSGIEKRRRESD